ncbi:MAG: YcxB family protein [Sphingomonas bacterium]
MIGIARGQKAPHDVPVPAISFQPMLEDVLNANRLHFTASLKARRMRRASLLGGALGATAGLAIAWLLDLSMVLMAVIGLASWLLFLSSVLLAAYLRLPGQARLTFAQQKSLQGEVAVKWSDVGISMTSERGHAQLKWEDFVEIIEGRDAILLRQTDTLFSFVPKRLLSEEQAASIVRHRSC